MINRRDVEIRTQKHLMDAEGCHENPVTEEEVRSLLRAEGWEAENLEMWEDNVTALFLWAADIKRI